MQEIITHFRKRFKVTREWLGYRCGPKSFHQSTPCINTQELIKFLIAVSFLTSGNTVRENGTLSHWLLYIFFLSQDVEWFAPSTRIVCLYFLRVFFFLPKTKGNEAGSPHWCVCVCVYQGDPFHPSCPLGYSHSLYRYFLVTATWILLELLCVLIKKTTTTTRQAPVYIIKVIVCVFFFLRDQRQQQNNNYNNKGRTCMYIVTV